MFCRKCGTELKDEWQVCPKCGEPVPKDNEENITEQSREVLTDNKAENTEHFGDSATQSTYVSNNKKNNNGIIIGVVVALIVIGVAVFFLLGKKDKKVDVPKEDKKTETEVSDFSKQDFEELVGKTAEDVKKAGLVEKGTSGKFEGLSGNVVVMLGNGQVNYVEISGDATKAPTFHGVSLGMTEEEAGSKLADAYPQTSKETNGIRVYNLETKATVLCGLTDGKIDSIIYRIMDDTELQNYQNSQTQEYIFPDSDKKYLSEDEVRSVDASQLSLGRNEIFARHGYIFKDDSINQYFAGKSWYQGTVPADQFDMDSVLNDFERKNVELIKKVENEVNGTSSQSFIGIEGTYQCGSDDDSGVIGVSIDGNDIYFTIGTHSNPGFLGGVGGAIKGTIENSNTATIDYGDGLIFKMVWKDKGVFVITRTTSSGWDEIDDITDNVEYVNAEYYGVS
ncbi:MAG: YARHG domain-containing protein [Dorea formicigenerans]|nr:YARHG domain-containing protein [Dorea formicigenerans]